jgi:hypothetical protein
LKFGSEAWLMSGVWRHYGKQMNKETKLRIHNITAKAGFKFGSEFWVLKKREEKRLEAAEMKFSSGTYWE